MLCPSKCRALGRSLARCPVTSWPCKGPCVGESAFPQQGCARLSARAALSRSRSGRSYPCRSAAAWAWRGGTGRQSRGKVSRSNRRSPWTGSRRSWKSCSAAWLPWAARGSWAAARRGSAWCTARPGPARSPPGRGGPGTRPGAPSGCPAAGSARAAPPPPPPRPARRPASPPAFQRGAAVTQPWAPRGGSLSCDLKIPGCVLLRARPGGDSCGGLPLPRRPGRAGAGAPGWPLHPCSGCSAPVSRARLAGCARCPGGALPTPAAGSRLPDGRLLRLAAASQPIALFFQPRTDFNLLLCHLGGGGAPKGAASSRCRAVRLITKRSGSGDHGNFCRADLLTCNARIASAGICRIPSLPCLGKVRLIDATSGRMHPRWLVSKAAARNIEGKVLCWGGTSALLCFSSLFLQLVAAASLTLRSCPHRDRWFPLRRLVSFSVFLPHFICFQDWLTWRATRIIPFLTRCIIIRSDHINNSLSR